MPEYQLEIKQLVSYPRCRIYRDFLQTLIADRGVRTNGRPGLFCYTVLCSYANFRTSYLRLDGISHTIYPGEWICRVGELTAACGCAPAVKRWERWMPCKTATSSNIPCWDGGTWSNTKSSTGTGTTLCWTTTAPVRKRLAASFFQFLPLWNW